MSSPHRLAPGRGGRQPTRRGTGSLTSTPPRRRCPTSKGCRARSQWTRHSAEPRAPCRSSGAGRRAGAAGSMELRFKTRCNAPSSVHLACSLSSWSVAGAHQWLLSLFPALRTGPRSGRAIAKPVAVTACLCTAGIAAPSWRSRAGGGGIDDSPRPANELPGCRCPVEVARSRPCRHSARWRRAA